MFIHLNIFKRKEEKDDLGHPELIRKNRVEKSSRKPEVRPRTAPGVLGLPTQVKGSVNRRSLQHGVQLVDEPLTAPTPLFAAARLPTPRDESSRPPFALRRSLSAASCVIRNPFRSDTSESVVTIGYLTGSTESVNVISRTVPSHTPTRRTTPPLVAPQRAAVFTGRGALSDSEDTLADSESPATHVVFMRSKSFDDSEISCTEKSKPVRPPLRRSSHEHIISRRNRLDCVSSSSP